MSVCTALLYACALLVLGGAALSLALRREYGGSAVSGLTLCALTPGAAAVINGGATLLRLHSGAFSLDAQVVAIVFLAVAACAAAVCARSTPTRFLPPAAVPPPPLLARLVVLGLVLSAVSFAGYVLENPEGRMDAWTQWNLKARYVWLAGEDWRAAFGAALPWTHPSYPVLLPLNVATFYQILDADPCIVGVAVACAFTAGAAGLLWAALRELGARGGLALALLCLTPVFGEYGARQQADMPLAYFFLAAAACLALWLARGRAVYAALGAFFAAGAASTKNEGLVFLAAVCAAVGARSVVWLVTREGPAGAAAIAACAVAIAASIWPFWIFATQIAPAPFVLEQTPVEELALGAAWPARLGTATVIAVSAAVQPLKWAGLPAAVAVLCLAAAAVRRRSFAWPLWPLWLLPAVMVCGYAAAYVLSPEDTHVLVRGSVSRLALQVWPAILFCGALLVHRCATSRGATS